MTDYKQTDYKQTLLLPTTEFAMKADLANREPAMLAQDPRTVSDRVDAITSSLSGTSDWIVKQQSMLGQIEELRKEPARAIVYYTRVYLAHQKYKDWMAKAYLQKARCLVQIGGDVNLNDAKALLEEFLRRQDVRDQPEYKAGQEEMRKLGGVVPP